MLSERRKLYGGFKDVADVSEALYTMLLTDDIKASPFMSEGLKMICNKLARISCGNPKLIDSWKDIAGYAELVSICLEEEEGAIKETIVREERVNGEWMKLA